MSILTDYVKSLILVLACLALLPPAGVAAQAPTVDASAQTEPFLLYRTTLPNGLRLWIQPRAGSKSVALYLILRAGARYETPANSGISHFIEHMLFTGTERWGEEEIKEIITARGGQWNGWTGMEETAYWAYVAAADFDLALDWLNQVVFHPTFPADKIEKERAVIFEEKWGRHGWIINTLDAWGFGYELQRDVQRALFPGSPLGQRVIGEDASLDSLDRQALLDYYHAFYTPANAALIVVGAVTPEQVQQSVDILFGDLAGSAHPPALEEPSMPDTGPHTVTVRGPLPTDQVTLMLGMRTVGCLHPDRWALSVLARLLDTSLTQEIRYRQGLVYGLSVYNTRYADTGYLSIQTTSSGRNRSTIQSTAEEYVQRIGAGQVDPEEVARAKAAIQGSWALSMEDNQSRALWLAGWATILSDDDLVPNPPAEINAVTPEDLTRVVATYYTPERRFVGLHLPILTVTSAAWLAAGFVAIVGAIWTVRHVRRRRHA
ncbi:MAG: insulinase family protein [Anaerolineae bacterium]|nr:insulinase family protein [Anaerolineae bacterium]